MGYSGLHASREVTDASGSIVVVVVVVMEIRV